MSAPSPALSLAKRLHALRVELHDLAFEYDTRGRHDAADLATTIAARLDELGRAPPRHAPRRRRLASAPRSARPARA